MASDEFKKLGLSFTEVSAKSGQNIKEFFKDLAFVTAGGKKNKEDANGKKDQPTAQPVAPSTTNKVKL